MSQRRLFVRLHGLRVQTLLWSVLPATILLIIFSVTGVEGHQESMKSLASQENSRLVLALSELIAIKLENIALRDDIAVDEVPIASLDLEAWLSIEHIEAESATILLNEDASILFRWGDLLPTGDPMEWSGVAEALDGQHAVIFTSETLHGEIVAYAPIRNRPWVLLIRESWHALTAPLIQYEQVLPFILLTAMGVSFLVLFFGLRDVVRPLQELKVRAARIGNGEFDAASKPVGGVQEIEDLRLSLNDMARQVRSYQAALRDYLQEVTNAQEEERARLARELHDETVQTLIALGHKAQMVQRALTRDPATVAEPISELRQMVAAAIDEVRRFSSALHPHYLAELGLATALQTLSREANAEFIMQGDLPRMKPEKELVFYRIAQEALNNAVRHAQASSIRLELTYTSAQARLRVTDNGVGFVMPSYLADLTRAKHFGLIGMRERSTLVGGELKIQSVPNQGTQVDFTLK